MAALMLAMAGAAWAAVTPPPLRITDVSPDGGSTGVSTTANPVFTIFFDKDMDSNSVFENVKLKKAGARRAIDMSLTYYFVEKKVEGTPYVPLKPNTTYKVIVDGGRDGVRSVDGGKLGGVDDPSARFRDGKVYWSFKTGDS
jgi:Bacterial Ig-like domain